MALNLKSQLLLEYQQKITFLYTPLVKFGGLGRFDIKDGKIVIISRLSQLYSIIIILVIDICGYLLFLETTVRRKLLIFPEYVSIIQYILFHNTTVLDIIFTNRFSGATIMNNFIEIDAFLGIKETKFMRDIVYKEFMIWFGFIGIFQVLVIPIILVIFEVPRVTVFAGVLFFTLLFSFCYDHAFHVVLYTFLSLRIHYINVSLVKIAKLDKEYLKAQLLSYPFLWKKEYNDLVDFHTRADTKYIVEAYKLLFEQLQRIAKSYQYLILNGVASVIMSTFLVVQSIIIYIKDPEMPVVRISHLTGWFIVNWVVIIRIAQQINKFKMQTQRTKLICTCIQLNPDNSDELFHLSQSMLEELGVGDCQISVYGLFHFDGALLRAIATSTFVYITMQFQYAFPNHNE